MPYQNLKPTEARDLIENQGWTYVDVRSAEEFAGGHVPGAYNVPVAVQAPTGGMAPNSDFARVIDTHFAPDARLVLGCAAGGRSAHACELLAEHGYTSLVNMQNGFLGARDASGRVVGPGWKALGYPVESTAPLQRTYAGLCARE